MARVYFDRLSKLIDELQLTEELSMPLAVRHFFSGAALYVDGAMCASWSPVGLAFKLPNEEIETLIASGEAVPLRYFPTGHIKKGYALFEGPDTGSNASRWRQYFLSAAQQA